MKSPPAGGQFSCGLAHFQIIPRRCALLQGPVSPIWSTSVAEEELRMTFQVGLVGSGCLLLGSDRKQRVMPTIFRGEEQYSEFIGQQKIKINSERTIAVACSGSDVVWESAEK